LGTVPRRNSRVQEWPGPISITFAAALRREGLTSSLGVTTNPFYIDTAVVMGVTYYHVVRAAELIGDEICQSNEANAKAIRPLWTPTGP
jgi:hypothetical protein